MNDVDVWVNGRRSGLPVIVLCDQAKAAFEALE
jgi:hypothetical protein